MLANLNHGIVGLSFVSHPICMLYIGRFFNMDELASWCRLYHNAYIHSILRSFMCKIFLIASPLCCHLFCHLFILPFASFCCFTDNFFILYLWNRGFQLHVQVWDFFFVAWCYWENYCSITTSYVHLLLQSILHLFYTGRAVINAAEMGISFPLKRRDQMLDYVLTLMGRDDREELIDSSTELLHTQVLPFLIDISCSICWRSGIWCKPCVGDSLVNYFSDSCSECM